MPVECLFEKRVRLNELFIPEGEIWGFETRKIKLYRPLRIGCAHKYDKVSQISRVVGVHTQNTSCEVM